MPDVQDDLVEELLTVVREEHGKRLPWMHCAHVALAALQTAVVRRPQEAQSVSQ